MAKSTGQRAHPQGTSARNRMAHRPFSIARQAAPDLSRDARQRLAMLDWHRGHGGNVSRTARHFGYSRPTVYRWLARFDRTRLETLEDRSSAPCRRRRASWTVDQLRAVRAIRETYPRWGKDKLVVLLRRAGVRLSTSMVGRILARLHRSGELHEPRRRRMSVHQRRWLRPYAIRKPVDWTVERSGDLVELDTLDIRPLSNLIWKQFTARDVSRSGTFGREANGDTLDRSDIGGTARPTPVGAAYGQLLARNASWIPALGVSLRAANDRPEDRHARRFRCSGSARAPNRALRRS